MPPRFDRSRLWGRGRLGRGGGGSVVVMGSGWPVGGGWLARGTTPEAGVPGVEHVRAGAVRSGVVVACDRDQVAMAGVCGSRLLRGSRDRGAGPGAGSVRAEPRSLAWRFLGWWFRKSGLALVPLGDHWFLLSPLFLAAFAVSRPIWRGAPLASLMAVWPDVGCASKALPQLLRPDFLPLDTPPRAQARGDPGRVHSSRGKKDRAAQSFACAAG